jgi:hypothetical protein
MFEVVANNTNTTTSYTLYLVDNAGIQITTSAITIPPNTTQRRFNILWTPNTGADNYRIKVPATAVAGQVQVHSAKMMVEQKNAVATKIYIPLTNSDFNQENSSDTIHVTSVTGTTYATSNFLTQWTRNDAMYDAIDAVTPWTLETITSTSANAATASAALFNKTSGLQITPAITNVTGSTALTLSSVSFASNATNFVDGSVIELRIKNSSGTKVTKVFKAGLWLKLKFLKKAEVLFRVATRNGTSAVTATLPDARFLWDAGAWSFPTVFFQTVASIATSSITLQDHGSNDVGITSPTLVTGSTITPTASFVIQRTSALTLVNMNRYFVQHNVTGGTPILGSAFIVIQAHD